MNQRGRLFHGITANALALITRAAYQLALIPILFIFWDASRVGTWMLLSTIPSYLVLSTLGFAGAGGNAIAAAAIEENLPKAQAIFKAIWLFVTCSNLLVSLLLYLSLAAVLPYLHLANTNVHELYPALAGLCLYVFFHVQFTILELSFRFTGRYPSYIYLECASTLFELFTVYAVLKFSSSYGLLAFGLAGNRLAFLFIGLVLSTSYSRSLWQHWDFYSICQEFKALLPASTGFVLAGIIMSVNVQGYVLLIGSTLGASLLTTFVTIRTLVRFFDTIINFIYNLLTIEMSYVPTSGSREAFIRVGSTVSFLLFILALIFVTSMLLFGQMIHHIWTHGQASFSLGLLVALLVGILLRSLAAAPSAILASANRNYHANMMFAVVSFISIGAAYVTAKVSSNLVGVATWSILAELGQLVIVTTLLARLTASSPRALITQFGDFRKHFTWLRNVVASRFALGAQKTHPVAD